MIYLAIGSNLPTIEYGGALGNCEAALEHLEKAGISVAKRSRWYITAPVPASEQPDYVNGAAACRSELAPHDLLRACQEIEFIMGRARSSDRNAARTIDIDIVDWDGVRIAGPELEIPHPRLAERLFVLNPLRDIAPHWRHPVTGISIDDLLAALGDSQEISLCP